ncbi:hypothetical protein [Methylobacterium brachythecii]|uniref:Uncharacterized protein n=1 Tax=Methylobacterium brachythecii TaxID=1176177 RepID=A0A7W6ANZ6_9HYPH|nr:hypothetical protein [Methylobacterium brachythecii]MBB3903182.1 hypothetical protein [Methylobacterium brachythecii]
MSVGRFTVDLRQSFKNKIMPAALSGASNILNQCDQLVRNGAVEIVMPWPTHGSLRIRGAETPGYAARG